MELNDILTLSKAGFTAQQIAALATVKPAQTSVNVATPTPTPTPTPPPTPTTTDAEKTQLSTVYGQIGGTTQPSSLPAVSASPIDGAKYAKEVPGQEMMAVFKSLLQSTAVNLSAQPPQETTDDILASIINPPEKEG